MDKTEFNKGMSGRELSFYAVKNRAVFHRPDCRFISGRSANELVGLYDYDQGLLMGMTPCNCCVPRRENLPEDSGWDTDAIERLCEKLDIRCDIKDKNVCITTGAAEWRFYRSKENIVLHHESWLYKNRKYGKWAGFDIRDKVFAEPLEAVFYIYCHDKRYICMRKKQKISPSFAACKSENIL